MANLNYLAVLWVIAFGPICILLFYTIYNAYLRMKLSIFGIIAQATITNLRVVRHENTDSSGNKTVSLSHCVQYEYIDQREYISNECNLKLISKVLNMNQMDTIPRDIINLLIEFMGISFYYGPYSSESVISRALYIDLSVGDIIPIKYDSKYQLNAMVVEERGLKCDVCCIFIYFVYGSIILLFTFGIVGACVIGLWLSVDDYRLIDQIVILFLISFISILCAIMNLIRICKRHQIKSELHQLQIDMGLDTV